ncbi:MAG: DUF6440 family protein [Oscillospiraceae bacterium]
MSNNTRFVKAYGKGAMEGNEIWVDTETGVNYLFHFAGSAGGLSPLLDRDGRPVVSSQSEIDELLKK